MYLFRTGVAENKAAPLFNDCLACCICQTAKRAEEAHNAPSALF